MKRALFPILLCFAAGCGKQEAQPSKSAEQITAECMAKAGIPANEPNYKVSWEQLQSVTTCAEREIKK